MARKQREPKTYQGELRGLRKYGEGWYVLSVFVDGRWVHVHFDPTTAEDRVIESRPDYHCVPDVYCVRAKRVPKVVVEK